MEHQNEPIPASLAAREINDIECLEDSLISSADRCGDRAESLGEITAALSGLVGDAADAGFHLPPEAAIEYRGRLQAIEQLAQGMESTLQDLFGEMLDHVKAAGYRHTPCGRARIAGTWVRGHAGGSGCAHFPGAGWSVPKDLSGPEDWRAADDWRATDDGAAPDGRAAEDDAAGMQGGSTRG
ncbi:MAG: hypothetical protein Q4F72_12485 [Desulfovibrionaceae bacterium]|nr:hypothetical protein [Desulfovibrionaceae bacterium]